MISWQVQGPSLHSAPGPWTSHFFCLHHHLCHLANSQHDASAAGFGAAKHLSSQGYDVTLLDAAANPGGLSAGWRTAQGRAVEAGIKGFWYQVRPNTAGPRRGSAAFPHQIPWIAQMSCTNSHQPLAAAVPQHSQLTPNHLLLQYHNIVNSHQTTCCCSTTT
jgi:hypothetical protein